MCRHALPRFDLHLGQALRHGAEWVGLHPTLAVAGMSASAAVTACAVAYPGVSRSLGAWISRIVPQRAPAAWRFIDGSVRTQNPG